MGCEGIFAELESHGDAQRAAEMSAYMKDNFSFLGVPMPVVREIIRPYLRAAKKAPIDWSFIGLCWEKGYREAQYVGVEYIRAVEKQLTEQDLPKLKELIVTKPWWDVADSLDAVVGNLLLKYPAIQSEMLQWSAGDDLWLRRVAINCQQEFKDKTDTGLLEEIIGNNLGTGEFFIDKAIGWSLRDYSKTDPDWVRTFLQRHEGRLSKLSVREAGKYL